MKANGESIGLRAHEIPCLWCEAPTLDLANAQCDRCLHLSCRIARDLALARRMIAALSRCLVPVAPASGCTGITGSTGNTWGAAITPI